MPLTGFSFSSHVPADLAWFGLFSSCNINGSLISYMKSVIEGLPQNKRLVVSHCDGFSDKRDYSIYVKDREDLDVISTRDDVVGAICTRNFTDPRLVLMPLDDETFEHGLIATVGKQIKAVPWENKISKGFWRGLLSGGDFPNPRFRIVHQSRFSSRVDAKLVLNDAPGWMERMYKHGYAGLENHYEYWSERVTPQEHARYKYILIVDGNCIASSHQWVFATGSVPLMVTHPDNDFWFKRYLKPMETFVPIDYSLCDLEEKIQWLIDNDDKARKIAENARIFAASIFSSEFQKYHLRTEIERLVGV
jgi:hypothetical protein